MPTWRDDWRTEGSVVIIAPRGVDGDLIRHATALVFAPRSSQQSSVQVSDSFGTRYRLALPATVLDGDFFAYDTDCTLRVQTLNAEGNPL